MVSDNEIINYFFNTNNGIKTTARFFSLTSSYVGSIIQAYKKKYDIR